jgi:hypothetical protein
MFNEAVNFVSQIRHNPYLEQATTFGFRGGMIGASLGAGVCLSYATYIGSLATHDFGSQMALTAVATGQLAIGVILPSAVLGSTAGVIYGLAKQWMDPKEKVN